MTPLGIVFVLRPLNTQVYEPLVPKQVNDLAALVAPGPAVMLIAVKSAGEYENFHSSAAGSLSAELKERFSGTLPPTGATPEERDNETCAELIETQANAKVDKSVSLRKQHSRKFITMGTLSFGATHRL